MATDHAFIFVAMLLLVGAALVLFLSFISPGFVRWMQSPSSSSLTTVEIILGIILGSSLTTASRVEELPDIPTVGDFVPGYESSAWYGVGLPRNTSADIIDKLNREINAALADPKIKARIADLSGAGLPGSPADFGKLIADETEKWAKVIKFANIKAE